MRSRPFCDLESAKSTVKGGGGLGGGGGGHDLYYCQNVFLLCVRVNTSKMTQTGKPGEKKCKY